MFKKMKGDRVLGGLQLWLGGLSAALAFAAWMDDRSPALSLAMAANMTFWGVLHMVRLRPAPVLLVHDPERPHDNKHQQ